MRDGKDHMDTSGSFISIFSCEVSVLDILTVSGVLLPSFSQVLEWEEKIVSMSPGSGDWDD